MRADERAIVAVVAVLAGAGCRSLDPRTGANDASDVATDAGDVVATDASDVVASDVPTPTVRCPDGGGCLAQVAAGAFFACGRTQDGRVYCWGNNALGELGGADAGALGHSPVPVQVALPEPATLIAVGSGHACAVTNERRLYCWGENYYGQLGVAGPPTSGAPQRVVFASDAGVAAVGAGWFHTCATLMDHTLWCWGGNTDGQLGHVDAGAECVDGAPCMPTPTQVPGVPIDDPRQPPALGFVHTCVLLGGRVYCWGNNYEGQLGIGDAGVGDMQSAFPSAQQVAIDAGTVTAVASSFYTTCAIAGDAGVQCWGFNGDYQAGAPTAGNVVASPSTVVGLSGVTDVSPGARHTCAIAGDAEVRCWGTNYSGLLGGPGAGSTPCRATSDASCSPVPVRVPLADAGTARPVEVSAGVWVSCVRMSDGTAQCWGDNEVGEVGNNSGNATEGPSVVALPAE